eukprot:scaffold15227_cov90-Isochrysis_galbana.AAC.1
MPVASSCRGRLVHCVSQGGGRFDLQLCLCECLHRCARGDRFEGEAPVQPCCAYGGGGCDGAGQWSGQVSGGSTEG